MTSPPLDLQISQRVGVNPQVRDLPWPTLAGLRIGRENLLPDLDLRDWLVRSVAHLHCSLTAEALEAAFSGERGSPVDSLVGSLRADLSTLQTDAWRRQPEPPTGLVGSTVGIQTPQVHEVEDQIPV
jgi:hypothetical protein